MRKCFFLGLTLLSFTNLSAQENISPAAKNSGNILIKNATVHVGNGQVLSNTSVLIKADKIAEIGPNLSAAGATEIDATGKHVYPGLILSNSQMGLREIASVRGSNDYRELGEINPNVKAITAYNADSRIINVDRSNGILLANSVPVGSLIAGTSAVVQMDAWNSEDALYKDFSGLHVYLPNLLFRPSNFGPQTPVTEQKEQAQKRIEEIKKYFRDAKGYLNADNKTVTNLKLEAAKGLFAKSEKLFVHCDIVKEMLVAVDIAKEFGFDVVIVGGSESFRIAPLLKQHNISVILGQMHNLPTLDDDDIDQPFKTPAVLQKAGILFAINDEDGNTTGRNLAFNAGTASAYGLSKEEALQAITLNPAKILGIADKAGSVEVGKDANIIISTGDILDMKSSIVGQAFIQGRKIELNDKQKELNEKYSKRYGVK